MYLKLTFQFICNTYPVKGNQSVFPFLKMFFIRKAQKLRRDRIAVGIKLMSPHIDCRFKKAGKIVSEKHNKTL